MSKEKALKIIAISLVVLRGAAMVFSAAALVTGKAAELIAEWGEKLVGIFF